MELILVGGVRYLKPQMKVDEPWVFGFFLSQRVSEEFMTHTHTHRWMKVFVSVRLPLVSVLSLTTPSAMCVCAMGAKVRRKRSGRARG